ncbi:carbamoyl transferase [sediment metagenome]|uniref:Carbamoyl transferase n=1 Tax=sediment metagenome TaxID=749907 RepID=D9PF29_9ZZZZ
MKILGISCYYHDSAAALIADGDIKSAVQEERFTRKKHDASFPVNSIRYCLQTSGLKGRELDAVVFYEKPLIKFERLLESYLAFAPKGIKSFMMAMAAFTKQKLWIASDIRRELDFKKEISYVPHHLSHAASAFFPSPFGKAVILTADGVGEWTTTSICSGQDNQIQMLKEIKFPDSLGLLYSAFTYYTGFKVNSGEYKVMGLAPYGEPKYVQLILDNLIDVKDDGSFRLNQDYFNYISGLSMTSDKFHRLFDGPPRKAESKLTAKEMDLARSVQDVTEMIMERIVAHAMKLTGYNKVCLAGGVALNCVANGKLVKNYR